ncbi:MAG: hypothetical protein ACRC8Y_04085 [Chroococcales cyanobacterium]
MKPLILKLGRGTFFLSLHPAGAGLFDEYFIKIAKIAIANVAHPLDIQRRSQ